MISIDYVISAIPNKKMTKTLHLHIYSIYPTIQLMVLSHIFIFTWSILDILQSMGSTTFFKIIPKTGLCSVKYSNELIIYIKYHYWAYFQIVEESTTTK